MTRFFYSALLLMFWFSVLGCASVIEPDPQAKVSIKAGVLTGFSLNSNTHAWLGIPYAAPPVGELRWRAPQPPIAWKGNREATAYGEPCPQLPNIAVDKKLQKGRSLIGSEDCLYLNVYAPKAGSEEPLPVMFWIHGGGNHYGSADIYEGASRLTEKGVVLVSLNYRLGLLGWFRHAALREGVSNPADLSGNFGTLDLVAALEWVQENIKAFGGDPGNVTVFGESAGGRNTWSMVFSPLAKGLFHKAIAQSASLRLSDPIKSENYESTELDYAAYENHSAEVVAKLFPGTDFMESSELADALRALSPDEIYKKVAPGAKQRFPSPKVFIDGYVIERDTQELLANPTLYNSVPMIVGTNRYESKFYFAFDKALVGKRLGLLPKIKDEEKFLRNVEYGSDIWRAQSVDVPARLISQNRGAQIFAYRFDFDDMMTWPVNVKALFGAAHATEMIPLFRWYENAPFKWMIGDKHGAQALGEAMTNYWVEFACSGDPGRGKDGTLPHWSSWRAELPVLLLDSVQDGGIRMSEDVMTPAMIAQRLKNDETLIGDEKCSAYVDLFLVNYQMPNAFDPAFYRSLGDC